MPRTTVENDQHFWQGIAVVAYGILCALSVWLVASYGTTDFASLTFFDLALLGLAAFRAIHLITYDKVFEIVRAAFMDQEGTRLKSAERGWRRLMCEFIQCIWCTGMWSGLIVVTAYFLGTWGHYAVIVLSVAGLGSLLQFVSKCWQRNSSGRRLDCGVGYRPHRARHGMRALSGSRLAAEREFEREAVRNASSAPLFGSINAELLRCRCLTYSGRKYCEVHLGGQLVPLPLQTLQIHNQAK